MMIANHNQLYSCQTGSAVIVTQLVNVLGVDTTVLSTCLGVGKYRTVQHKPNTISKITIKFV